MIERQVQMTAFIPGLELSRHFHRQAVQPILAARYPQLRYSAGLIGSGSEVLGYDDAVSTDHNWGPRLMLFLSEPDRARYGEAITRMLRHELPHSFMGFPTNFTAPKTADDDVGTQLLQASTEGEVNHRVDVLSIDSYAREYLGLRLSESWSAADWLSIPQQRLLGFSAGAIFYDELDIGALRDRLAWYPHAVWLYLLACAWSRIGQDEHLAPRAGALGDELGSALIAGRLVRSIVLLCFLMEKRYAPYPKWLGRAFSELDCGPRLIPILRAVQRAADFRVRERHLCAAYELLNEMHNGLGLTAPISPSVAEFHERGFRVSAGWRYCQALTEGIHAAEVAAIAARSLIGGIDLFSDSTDLREATHLRADIAALISARGG